MVFNVLHSKRGEALVEAALIWPFIILSVLAVLTMVMSLFAESVILSCSHMSLKEVAGEWTQTVSFSEELPIFKEMLPSKDVPKRLQIKEESWMNQSRIPIPRETVEGHFAFYCLYPNLSIRINKNYGGFGFLKERYKKETNCQYQCIDEAQLIRNWDYAAEVIDEVKNNDKK
ncbi:hypothetical protein [Anaerovorax sp. IOR16]|uniref:hypothetical protein n=1 Tax=Anaerovorax sp. IOR16 TaxID=2773458 RepID=UPI0019D16919|nr:hypothetical protein [Anaerovorax sp. IOR16]